MRNGTTERPAVTFEETSEKLSLRLAEWRRNRVGRARIPDELWAEAVDLAAHQGIFKTARALRLDYASLKKRVNPAISSAQATFVEVFSPLSGAIPECALDVESSRGAKLHVEMKNVPPLGLAAILRDFAS